MSYESYTPGTDSVVHEDLPVDMTPNELARLERLVGTARDLILAPMIPSHQADGELIGIKRGILVCLDVPYEVPGEALRPIQMWTIMWNSLDVNIKHSRSTQHAVRNVISTAAGLGIVNLT